MSEPALLQRRLAAFRDRREAQRIGPASGLHGGDQDSLGVGAVEGAPLDDLASRLAAAVGGVVLEMGRSRIVRREAGSIDLPLDRERLGRLPGWPPATAPLVCLDTETTGLATAAGTVAFLVGVGWWHGDAFHQVQLLMPDHSDEPALLSALADVIPPDGWLVTYNGRGFDWPLLEARYRMDRRPAPRLAGHLDLLPFVRRVFRHRLGDARLRTVERGLLGVHRVGDVEGWEIPGRYLDFLRGGPADGLAEVVRHNERDIASLAELLGLVATSLADPESRTGADAGDLVGLARVFRDARRHADALACLDAALTQAEPAGPDPTARRIRAAVAVERARALRRVGRAVEALAAWRALATSDGPFAGIALVEVAKALEHRWADPTGALEAVDRARALAERTRSIGRPMPNLEADLAYRRARLVARVARRRTRTISVPVARTTPGFPHPPGLDPGRRLPASVA